MQHQFEVKGMTCGHCEMAVKKAVMRLDPQATLDIRRQENKVTVKSEHAHEAFDVTRLLHGGAHETA